MKAAILALAASYRAAAADQRAWGDTVRAPVLERVAAELEAAVAGAEAKTLTLAEARAASGYSDRALRAMIADGRLENVGRKHAPRVRAGDLPRKHSQAAPAGGYDATADALSLVTRGGRPAA